MRCHRTGVANLLYSAGTRSLLLPPPPPSLFAITHMCQSDHARQRPRKLFTPTLNHEILQPAYLAPSFTELPTRLIAAAGTRD